MVPIWLFTSDGFVSAVEHRENENYLMVRARDKKSLENLVAGSQMAGHAEGEVGLELSDIYSEPNSDYAHRIVVSKATFALWTSFEIMNMLTYPNFKSEAAKYRSGPWMTALHNVWSAMNRLDEAEKPYYGSHHYSAGYDSRRGVDYNQVFGSSVSDFDRGSEDDMGAPYHHQSALFRNDFYDDEPSAEELEEIESLPSLQYGVDHTDSYDYLKGRFAEGENGVLMWTPYTDEEYAELIDSGVIADTYNGEVFFRKNEAGEWVDVNDQIVPVIPESDSSV